MDQVIHRKTCDEEGESGIDPVSPSNGKPCRSEAFSGLCTVGTVLRVPFDATNGTFGLVRGGEFDNVGDEEMARNKQVENKTEENVLPAVIVAAYTNENSVLGILSGSHQSKHSCSLSYLHEILNNQS